MKTKSQISCLKRWIALLSRDRNPLQVYLQGVPGKMRIPQHWQVRMGPQREHLLYYVVEGGFEARIGEQILTPGAGDLLWMAPETPFQFRLLPGQKLLINRFRLLAPDLKHPSCSGHFLFGGAWSCQVWMEHIVQETGEKDCYHGIRLRAQLLCLVTELARIGGQEPEGGRGFSRTQKQKLMQLAFERIRSRPQPAELAGHLGLSHDYFTRLFKQSFRKPPRRWLVEQRIQHAALRLRESLLNISEIAEEFGYQDVFLFSKQFKEVQGMSPLAYRRKEEP